MAERDYVLGTHNDEIYRLGFQHRVWRPRALDAWARARIGDGCKVIDFGSLKLVLKAAAPASGAEGAPSYVAAAPEVAINYGKFINAAIKFVIVAWVLFLVIQMMNRLKRKEEAAPPPVAETPADVKLLTEIRDLLKNRQ